MITASAEAYFLGPIFLLRYMNKLGCCSETAIPPAVLPGEDTVTPAK
jgi:hypothetical protein